MSNALLLREKTPSRRWINRNLPAYLDSTKIQGGYFLGVAMVKDDDSTLEEVREGVKILEDTLRTSERVLGQDHPTSVSIREFLEASRGILAGREAQSSK